MNGARRRFFLSALKMFDVFALILCFALASVLVAFADKSVTLVQFLSLRIKLSNCLIFAVLLLVWHFCFRVCGLYESRRLSSRGEDILDASKAIALSIGCLALSTVFVRMTLITPRFLLFFWVLGTLTTAVSRAVLRKVLEHARRRGRNLRYVLVIGTNARATAFARGLENAPEVGYRVLGFVDDEWPGAEEFRKSGFEVVCDRAGLPDFLRRNIVDEVAIYLPLRSSYEYASHVAALCELHGINMRFDGAVFSLKNARSRADEIDGESYVSSYAGGWEWGPVVVKRALDITISSALLLLLAPLFAAVSLLVSVTSTGPIFYFQERIGLNKRRFRICKFRTMVPNAEKLLHTLESLNEASGPVFKIKNDPRITPLGRILRRTSIDELPQLLNVLKGDMSLVGPRPLPVRDYEGFDQDWQRRRFSVRPGITCLWQVSGRSSLPFEQWMELDLQYMDEWSLWLDLKILARTIPVVLKGTGAA